MNEHRPDTHYRRELRERLRQQTGCLTDPSACFYPLWAAAILSSQVLGWTLMTQGPGVVAVIGALVAGIGQVHAGSFGHDASHGARGLRDRRQIAWFMFNLVLGYPASRWKTEHDRAHHLNLQMLGADPNLEAGKPFLALCRAHVDGRGGLVGWMRRHQHVWFFPVLTLSQGVRLTAESLACCARYRRAPDLLGVGLHLAAWWGVPLVISGPARATLMFGVLLCCRGAYFFLIVVNHHVGAPTVPTLPRHSPFRAQIECSVDLRTPPVLVAFLGRHALHHAFPNIPSQRLAEGCAELADFCEQHGLTYSEKSWLGSLGDVQRHVKSMALLERARFQENTQRRGLLR